MGEDNCKAIVNNAWKLSMNTGAGKAAEAVQGVAGDLWYRSRNVLGDLEKRIKQAKKVLEVCKRRALTRDSVSKEEILKYRLERLEEQHELYWR